MIQSLAQHLDPSPNRGNSTRGHLMVSAICSFKGSQSKRTRGPEPRSPVVGFTAQRQAWGTDGVWRNGGGPHALEEEMATHYSILAWRISWTEEPGGL